MPSTQANTLQPPALEPRAIEVLKAASSKLASARNVSFTAVEVFETSSRHGHPLALTTRYEVAMQRPDKLRVLVAGDGPASEFYYNGKLMMALAPSEDLIAMTEAPPTIDATLEAAYKQAAIYFPFTDILVTDPYKDMQPGLKLAYYVGQSKVVGGTTTDIVAYVDQGVFLQMWVGAEDKLPRMIRAVYLDDPAQLRHQLEISNWQLDTELPEETFRTARAGTAKHIAFAHPHPETSSGTKAPVKPAAKPKSASAKTNSVAQAR
ncbi:MAG TPA: DUF2092 domain-containing protein [Candidatus Limnocylindrales bacterium]|nr:DUF2092 domain-containing protein [Candidatus Limnocylindrales bacterium]